VTDPPTPSAAVLAAFNVNGARIEPLAGGEETSVLAGDVVLKHVQDIVVSVWGQALLADVRPVGVAVPEPIATLDGAWAADGWIATRFLDGLRSVRDDPAAVIEAGQRLADAIAQLSPVCVDPVKRRADRWARADRCAWGEETVPLTPAASDVAQVLRTRICRPSREPTAVVHGDLSGNVFVGPSGVRVVLDFTPIVRPPRFAAAIVVGDNLLWSGGSVELRTLLHNDDDALARALLFRLIAEQLADRPRHGANLDDYRRVIEKLGWAG
jgi:uncharacterized protein (TIGR02569 family)